MTIAELIAKAAPALGDVKAFLLKQREGIVDLKARFPDLASFYDEQIAELDAKVAALDEAASGENLAALAVTVVHELAGIKHGLKPASHAGDAV